MLWAGHRWAPDADGAVIRLALEHVREQQHRALDVVDSFERQKAIDHWAKFDRRAMLDNMLMLAKALAPIADAGESWDSDPWLLGTPNGVIDLRTVPRGAPRGPRITMSAGVPFDADAGVPRFEQFVAELFDGAAEMVGFVQRAVGYSLTGITTEQCLFMLYGTGANGKSTLVQALKFALGDYASNMPMATIELQHSSAIPNDLRRWRGGGS